MPEIEEINKLVTFGLVDGKLRILQVNANVWGDVKGTIWGRVYGEIQGGESAMLSIKSPSPFPKFVRRHTQDAHLPLLSMLLR